MKHPEAVVIKNRFYPDGLTEEEIAAYWHSVKDEILRQVEGKEVFLYISHEKNQTVVRRNERKLEPYRLTTTNYDRIMTGRVVGIVSTFEKSSSFGIIDIDIATVDDIASEAEFNLAKDTAKDVYDFWSHSLTCEIYYTGKNSFHIKVNFPRKRVPIDEIKSHLGNTMCRSSLMKRYSIDGRRNPKAPNLDLSSNKFRGGYITPYSINQIGLVCTKVDPDKLNSFKRESAVLPKREERKPDSKINLYFERIDQNDKKYAPILLKFFKEFGDAARAGGFTTSTGNHQSFEEELRQLDDCEVYLIKTSIGKMQFAVGYITMNMYEGHPWIKDYLISEKYRDQHVGTRALLMFLDELRKRGFKKVGLKVHANNPRARHMYEKIGFKRQYDVGPPETRKPHLTKKEIRSMTSTVMYRPLNENTSLNPLLGPKMDTKKDVEWTYAFDLDPKYYQQYRSMVRNYKPSPRPISDVSAQGPTGKNKSSMRVGSLVAIVEKENQGTGQLTQGQIIRILTPRSYHSRGIKVVLDSGKIGRVIQILVY